MKNTMSLLQESRFGVSPSRDFLYLYMVIFNNLQIIDLRTMEEMMTVDVRVGACLREYVICTRGCDVIVPAKDSVLWCLLKQHLVTSADGYVPVHPDLAGEYIRIALRNAHSAKTYSVPSGRVVQLNTLFRCFLDPTGERVIRRHLDHEFKKTFHDYMMGCSNNTDLKITEAIEEFCNDHRIDGTNSITIEMLRKDWYRFRLREANRIFPAKVSPVGVPNF